MNPPLLMQAFDFDHASLQQNRLGNFTKAQRDKIKQRFLEVHAPLLLIAVFFCCATVFMTQSLITLRPLLLIVQLVVSLLFLGYVAMTFLAVIEDLSKEKVKQRSGRIILGSVMHYITIYNGRKSHTVTIEGENFTISEREFFALENGQFYHLYYAPQTRIILSVEPINPEQSR